MGGFASVVWGTIADTLGVCTLESRASLFFDFLTFSCLLNSFFLTVPEKTGTELTSPRGSATVGLGQAGWHLQAHR